MESMNVGYHWKTSLNVGSLVTLVAAVHYFYMLLSAVQHDISSMMFYRLLIGTVAMLAFGYLGETSMLPAWGGFGLGLLGWFYILYEIFAGEAGNVSASGQNVNKHVQQSFKTMRFIVSV